MASRLLVLALDGLILHYRGGRTIMTGFERAALPSRSITTVTIIEKLFEISRWGFAGVSILPNELIFAREDFSAEVFDVIRDTGLKLLVHGSIGNTDSPDFNGRILKQIEITEAFHQNTGNVAVFDYDPGYAIREDKPVFDLENSVKALELASDLYTSYSIPLGIENAPSLPNLEELTRLAKSVSSFPVSLLLDIGHLFISYTKGNLLGLSMSEFIRQIPLPICEVHVHDNDGNMDRHLPLGDGGIDVKEIARGLNTVTSDYWITIESRPDGERFPMSFTRGFKSAVESVGLLRDAISDQHRFMRNADEES